MVRRSVMALVLGLLAAPLGAQDPRPSPSPEAPPSTFVIDGAPGAPAAPPSPRPAAPRPALPPGLKLGAYATNSPGEERIVAGPEVPRFSTDVEVQARAVDSAALTAKLAWWLRDFDGMRGPVAGAGRAPTLAEMRDFRPHPADSLDVNALVGWLVGKINEKRKN
jgi:hypothetical protein